MVASWESEGLNKEDAKGHGERNQRRRNKAETLRPWRQLNTIAVLGSGVGSRARNGPKAGSLAAGMRGCPWGSTARDPRQRRSQRGLLGYKTSRRCKEGPFVGGMVRQSRFKLIFFGRIWTQRRTLTGCGHAAWARASKHRRMSFGLLFRAGGLKGSGPSASATYEWRRNEWLATAWRAAVLPSDTFDRRREGENSIRCLCHETPRRRRVERHPEPWP